MLDVTSSLAGRRHLIYGGYALLLLAIAIVAGYLILAPSDLVATPLARPLPAPRTGLLIDRSRPAEPMRARQSWPKMVTGKILDGDRQPLEGASIVLDSREYRTGSDGTFEFEGAPSRTPLIVKMPGFEKVMVEPQRRPVEVVLRPHVVKAAYLTYFGVGDRAIRTRVLDPTDVIEAVAAGARGPATLRDFDALMSTLKSRGIYTIARIVAFKDNVLARHRPDLAIIDTRTGQPWIDNERLAWVDPFREEVWDYNIAIAREAVRRGFDEVQFDYVRFPTDGRLGAAQYSKPNTKATRLPAIVAFLERARHELGVMGAFVAADVFGYTAFNENDTDIGQRVEELTPHLDYISPMVYPSGYHRGIPGYKNPVEHPYEVVFESVRLILKRATHTQVQVRPWLQDFRDYAFDRRTFGVREILEQIRGADDGGAAGWMLWNPRNDYTGAALQPKEALAAK